uniref:Uncharacterized protein n=1 Tax=Amphiprion ocellaris TaxID=80972 RepID=A0AAQ5XWE1_AMPOC
MYQILQKPKKSLLPNATKKHEAATHSKDTKTQTLWVNCRLCSLHRADGRLMYENVTSSEEATATTESINLHVPVDLLGLPVATQQTTQDPHATHPGQLLWHTSVGGTLSLTWMQEDMSTRVLAAAGPGVDRNRFANDKTILHQFTDLLGLEAEWSNPLSVVFVFSRMA